MIQKNDDNDKRYKAGENVDFLNKSIGSGKTVFLLIHMDGCGPCNMVKPEWTIFKDGNGVGNGIKNESVVITNIERTDINKISIGNRLNSLVAGFPTILVVSDSGKTVETYDITADRTADAFKKWANQFIPEQQIIAMNGGNRSRIAGRSRRNRRSSRSGRRSRYRNTTASKSRYTRRKKGRRGVRAKLNTRRVCTKHLARRIRARTHARSRARARLQQIQ